MPNANPASPSAAVSGSALMANVRALAQWEKLSGTPGEMEAFRYIKGAVEALGFRTELMSHDAYISLPGKARVEVDGKPLTCITHSHSQPSPAGGLSGRLVYCGKGGKADFEGKDLKGCILLLEGIARPEQANLATLAGAAGQIHITPDHLLHEMCVSPVWGSPSQETRGRMPTTVVTTISREDGGALRERLQRGEAPQVVLHAEVDTGWRKTPVLIAEMDAPDAGPDAPFVLFSGHVDTWYFGVMDNGSANCTMLEVARLVAGQRDKWRRGLRLGFWSGHSHGRYSGSTWYADAHWADLDRRCVAHVNVDSTGGKGAALLTNSGSATELRGLATEVILASSGQKFGGRRVGRQGDESFWGVGLPAMFGSLSHHPPPADKSVGHIALGYWWHTPEDTLDKIDEETLVRDTKIFVDIIWRFLTDRVLPLDYVAVADDLAAEIGKIEGLEPGFSLRPLAEGAVALRDRIAALRARAEGASAAELARLNRALMRVSRALVPVDCTAGDRFAHDPALPLPAWPTLQPIRALAASTPETPEWHFQEVSALRARNRVAHALSQASEALDAVLQSTG